MPTSDDKPVRNEPTPQGRELGAHLVRLFEPVIRELAEQGEPDERCASCALRAGTYPNGCPVTLMDLIKCGIEGAPFYCHDKKRKGQTCHGWFAMRYSRKGEDGSVPWELSQ